MDEAQQKAEQKRLDGIADQLHDIVAKEFAQPDASGKTMVLRPKLTLHPRDQVKLRCESILQMAFVTWMREVRGEAFFTGPQDMWRLRQMQALLFGINGENGEFDKGEKS
jgi:hypothetical protein